MSTNNISILAFDNKQFYRQKPVISTVNTYPEENKTRMSKNQKLGVCLSTVLGTVASLAILAKCSKTPYSLNPTRILQTPLRDTFLVKINYSFDKVLAVGAGSCLGGYLGGLIFDKNKENKKAKQREAIMQYINMSLPIGTVVASSFVGDFLLSKIPKSIANSSSKLAKLVTKSPKILFPLAGLALGIWAGNKAANKLNQKMFKTKDDRPVVLTDLSAHVDDICLTSQYISKDNILTKGVSRFIPLALMVPGYEIGTARDRRYK